MALDEYMNNLLEMGMINLIQYAEYSERAIEAITEAQYHGIGHNPRPELDG